MATSTGVASALRSARTARGMSLSEVAAAAAISTATLSRIETEKQSVDVSLLLTLSRILHVSPADLVGGGDGRDTEDHLVATFAAMPVTRRARIITAAASQRTQKRAAAQLESQVDALLATIDMVRDELENLRRQMRRRRR